MNFLEHSLLADVDWNGLSTRWILTLGHFLWQGAVIGLVMAAALGFGRRASPQVRHGICLTSLLLLIPCLAVTFAWIEIEQPELPSPVPETAAISDLPAEPPLVDVSRIPSTALKMPIPVEAPQSWNANNPLPQEVVLAPPLPIVEADVPEPSPPAESTLSQMAPWIAVAYLLGVISLLFRTGLGLWGGQRLRAASERIQDSSLLAMIVRQAELVGLKTAPVVAYCNRVAVPTVIGIFKPMVLLPATLANGLEPNQLAAILSHELAHIRRYDLLVNLIQRFVESLLFFHPVVWWISRRVSIERENCCDDLASASGFGHVEYAGALLRMAELSAQTRRSRSAVQVTALSAEGTNPTQLSRRIERLLNMHSTPRLAVSRMLSLAAACIFVLSIATVGVWAQISNSSSTVDVSVAAKGDVTDSAIAQATQKNPSPDLEWGPESNGLRCWVGIPARSEDNQNSETTFVVELQNVSEKPITLIGVQREAKGRPAFDGKPDPDFFAPHLFEFEFFDADGKPVPRTSREFLDQPYLLNSARSHEIEPGKSLRIELTPAAFNSSMAYQFPPGKYRVRIKYKGPNDQTLAYFREHTPEHPRADAWSGEVVSNEITFIDAGDASRRIPEHLVWGEEQDGLQAAVEYRASPGSEEFNDPPGILPTKPRVSTFFHVKNVSDHTITFVSETIRRGDECIVTDESGETRRLQNTWISGIPIMVRWTLEPGEVAELRTTAGLGLIGTPGKYTLRYGINFRGVVKNNGEGESGSPKPTDYQQVLYTGETPITIHSRPLNLDSISPNGEIIGRLIDPETSEPIGGATVSCAAMSIDSGNKARVHAVTDGEGRYRLRVPSPGVYSVWLRNKPSNTDDGILVEAGKIAASSLRLISNRNVFGKVVDSAGNPIPNRVVSCYSPNRPYAGNVQSIRTKADGSFLLKVPPGRAFVHVDPKFGPPDRNLFGTNQSARVHLNIPETGKMEPITLTVLDSEPKIGDTEWVNQSTAGTQVVRREGDEDVSGTVVDENENPIEGAQVFRLDDAVSRTDKRGQFRIDTDKNTQFVMYAFAPGYHVWIGAPMSGDVLKIVMEPKKIPDPATPGTKDANQPEKKQSSVPDDQGIYWSESATDGFRTGARLVAKEGRITAGAPLEIQYILKNETDSAQSLDLVRSKPAFPSLEEENRIDLSLFPAHDKPQSRTLQAGEVWEDSQNRVSIDTTGFPAGEYVVWIQNFFLRPDPDDSNRKTGIPIRRSISVVIDPSKDSVTESEATNSPTEKSNDPDNIAWGKSVAGIQVGSRFVGESREFPIPSEPQLQLFVRNLTRTPIEIDVLLPHPNDGWLLNMDNDQGEHIVLQRTPISSFWPEQSYRLTLAPGKTIPITGVERTVNLGPTIVKHATFGIAQEKPSEGFWNGGILITNGGRYQAKLTVSLKRVDMPGLRLRVDAAAAPFRVNGPLLDQETPRPISLHGFNLAPYRASKNREELQKTEPILDRNRSHAEGGSWRCWLDSAEHYNQWLVCYDPSKQIFYVVDEKSEDKIVYGPIPGDAIEKLRLREGSSDLVAAKADEQNVARAANLHVRRIQSLLESIDISLQTHGLKAFVGLANLKTYELRNWSERIVKVADSDAGRGQLKPLVEAAQKYLQDQRDRIESLKVKLDDSEYKRGREPTQAELDAEWGPVSEGLSLAIADWPREVRKFDVNDQPQITLLVRNAGESPQRISTLDVLDGVDVIVTDEQTKLSARLDFTRFTGLARTERYLLQPGELVEIKRFSFQIKEGDLHPPGKTYNPRNLELMYDHINVRPNRTYRFEVTLSMPSAYNSLSDGKITMPAKGEFDGQLAAKPVRLALRGEDKDQASDNTTASLSGRIVYDGEPPAPKNLDLLRDANGVALKNPPAIRVQWNKLGIPDESLIVDKNGGIANVIVWVTSKEIAGRVKTENDAPPVTIRAKFGQFAPHVLAFWNVSPFKLKNDMLESMNLNWNGIRSVKRSITLPRNGSEYEFEVKGAERTPIQITTDFKPWMKAYVLPLDHPFFSVTKSDGRFEIKDLPKGTWEFAIWHERVGWLKTEKYPTGRFELEVGDAPIELGNVLVAPEIFEVESSKTDDKPKATDGPTKIPAEQPPQSSATPIKFRTIRLINGMTDRPLAGIKIRTKGAVAGKKELEWMEFVSDDNGLIKIPVRDEPTFSVPISSNQDSQDSEKYTIIVSGFDVVTKGWFQSGPAFVVKDEDMTHVPDEPYDYKLWPGQVVTGRMLLPDKTPAARVQLRVGVYINNQVWKKRLGMNLNFYSWDHGDMPNWLRRTVTDDNGVFTTTVPPQDACGWVRVTTPVRGYDATYPVDVDAENTLRALGDFIPFERQIPVVLFPIVTSPQSGQFENLLNFGDLQLKAGVKVRGRVTDDAGNGLKGVRMTTTGLHGPHSGRSATSGENGEFEFLAVEPGSLTIRPDARLRDEAGKVISREVQALFVDQAYPVFAGVELLVKAVPHVELEFDWVDRRVEDAPVSYYGSFTITGRYPVDEEQVVHWRGETSLVERDGRKLLVVKVPRDLLDAKLHLSQDRVVTASYEDEAGTTSGPGRVELGEITRPIKRTIFGDEPTKQ